MPGGQISLPAAFFLFVVLYDPAEMGIDVLIVLGVIFMAGRRQKDGVEIDRLDAKLLQVVQLVHDPLEVAPVKLAVADGRGRLVPVPDGNDRPAHIGVFPVVYVIGPVAVTEAVDEDLVHDRSDRPGRQMKAGHDMPVVRPADGIADPAAGIAVAPAARDHFKIIAEGALCDLKSHAVIIKALV